MKIRKIIPIENAYRVEDYLQLQRLCIETGAQADLFATQLEDLLHADVRLYVGIGEGENIVAGAYTRSKDIGGTELCGFVVHPEYRRRGHGSELAQFIIGSETADGVTAIELVVRIHSDGSINANAARMYFAVGFNPTGEIRARDLFNDPRMQYLASTLDPDGKFRSAVFRLSTVSESEVRYG